MLITTDHAAHDIRDVELDSVNTRPREQDESAIHTTQNKDNSISASTLESSSSSSNRAKNASVEHISNQQSTTTTAEPREQSRPPPLPYNLREHVWTITIFWFFILAECCFIPVTFYYGIGNTVHIREGALFAIITSVFGFVSGVEYALRGWRLLRVKDDYRPLNGSPRFWGFDATQWVLAQAYTVMTGVLIGFSIPEPPIVQGLALPMPLGMIILGLIFCLNGIAYHRGWTLKYFRLSSHPKGSLCPPLTLCVLEDVVSVDGQGGRKYREAVMARYRASPLFERLLVHLLWFWAVPSLVLGIAFIVIIYTIPKEIAYGIGWAGPCVWACIWAYLTFVITKRHLKDERRAWSSMAAQRA